MHVVDNLMSLTSIVLQNVVLLGARSNGDLLSDGQQISEMFVRDVVQFRAMVFGNYQRMTLREWTNVCYKQSTLLVI